MTEAKMRRVRISSPSSIPDLDGPVLDVLKWAQEIVDAVPMQFRDSAILDYDSSENWPILTIIYQRPETDADRQEDEKRRVEVAQAALERDHSMYLKLKAKFEG